mmetsp:Transcript_39759/g.98276  ORF Transcript_39759/g.98276 Transcript_39759/m.98276 type:complete len:217 (+) Transcript_39759:257-907(+)
MLGHVLCEQNHDFVHRKLVTRNRHRFRRWRQGRDLLQCALCARVQRVNQEAVWVRHAQAERGDRTTHILCGAKSRYWTFRARTPVSFIGHGCAWVHRVQTHLANCAQRRQRSSGKSQTTNKLKRLFVIERACAFGLAGLVVAIAEIMGGGPSNSSFSPSPSPLAPEFPKFPCCITLFACSIICLNLASFSELLTLPPLNIRCSMAFPSSVAQSAAN